MIGLLFPREIILVVAVKIRAAVVRALEETVHLVLVEVDKAGVTLILLVVYVIYALIAY